MISILPNSVLNSNLHALRARQTKGLGLEGKTKENELRFKVVRNQMPRVTRELSIKYVSEAKALSFSSHGIWNNEEITCISHISIISIVNNACHA